MPAGLENLFAIEISGIQISHRDFGNISNKNRQNAQQWSSALCESAAKSAPNGSDAGQCVQPLTFEFKGNTTELQQEEVNLLNVNRGHWETDVTSASK